MYNAQTGSCFDRHEYRERERTELRSQPVIPQGSPFAIEEVAMGNNFVARIAWQTIEEVGLSSGILDTLVMRSGEGPVWNAIYARVKRMNPSTLGIIVATGREFGSKYPTLYHVHCGTYVNKYWSGRRTLRVLATTALICKMYELLKEEEEELQALT